MPRAEFVPQAVPSKLLGEFELHITFRAFVRQLVGMAQFVLSQVPALVENLSALFAFEIRRSVPVARLRVESQNVRVQRVASFQLFVADGARQEEAALMYKQNVISQRCLQVESLSTRFANFLLLAVSYDVFVQVAHIREVLSADGTHERHLVDYFLLIFCSLDADLRTRIVDHALVILQIVAAFESHPAKLAHEVVAGVDQRVPL